MTTPRTALDHSAAVGGEEPLWSRTASHRPSHLGALPWVAAPDGPDRQDQVGLVVVPTSRDATRVEASGISLAARLATAHACPLLVVVSDEAERPESLQRVRDLVRRCGEVEAVVLSLRGLEPAFSLRTHGAPLGALAAELAPHRGLSAYVSDVARKRNSALLLARAAGYRTLLFVDDDIDGWEAPAGASSTTLDDAGLRRAVRSIETGRHRCVGWVARRFSDNSVLCRVRLLAGQTQGQMIGAGALLVSVDPATPFFPSIYNEDWLFLLADVAGHGRGAVARAGKVRQDEPEVAITVDRAMVEEFGDVLGEGLMNLVGRPGAILTVGRDRDYWAAALNRRRAMIHDLRRSLNETYPPQHGVLVAAGRQALEAVDELHAAAPPDLPDLFCDFVGRWQGDLGSWHELMRETPLTPGDQRHRVPVTV